MSHHQTAILIVTGFSLLKEGLLGLLGNTAWATVCGIASSARSARQICAEAQPQYVVIDLELADGNSIGLINDVCGLNPKSRVLALSDREDFPWVRRVFQAGAHAFVSKWDSTEEVTNGLLALGVEERRFVSRRLADNLLQESFEATNEHDRLFESLSIREVEVFRLLGAGKTAKEIGFDLCVSAKTVESHFLRMKSKLGLASMDQLRKQAHNWTISGKHQKLE